MTLREKLSPKLLGSDDDGTAAVEFAMIAPVLLGMLMGTFDIGQMAYAKSVLHGAVQEAARSASLETANTSAADARVIASVSPVLPNATFASERSSYFDFADIGRPEQWNDSNDNDTCDNDENFSDENGNGEWDSDIGTNGNGGAGDVVVYSVTVEYVPVFGIPGTTNRYGKRTLTASAIAKNQPFADQDDYGSDAGTCSDP
ncbi:MAG: TadE/TadG family type IV pilus assembly protein [Novosphingobium sp.]|nr:TadE/TadG family type IV pilus assembly protein [Novosphingobium sp.]